MTSALETIPRLQPDLTIVRRETQGKVHYVVKEPREGKYSKFGEAEIVLMRLMDGSRTPAQIAEAAGEELGVTLDAGQVADFAQKLKRQGLVERTPAEQHLMLMERLRAQRKLRARGRAKGSILRMRFSIGDPDRLFASMVPRLAWMWTPGFVALSTALFATYAAILVVKSREFYTGAAALYMHTGVSGWDYALSYLIILFVIGIHEMGHGLTTKRFGGEVHEIGAMLLYFMPALFCNTNDAWLFNRRSHRLWVTFAGPWIQLLVASVAAIAWLFMEPGTFLYRLTFLTILVGGVSGVLGNLNPLIPLDGYYALSDYLEIPNLRKRAFGYWGWLVKRHLLGIDAPEPAVSPRERKVFLVYGGLAFAYSFMAVVASLVWITFLFRRLMGPWIWIVMGLIVGSMLWRQRGRLQDLTFVATTSWRAGFVRSRKIALGLAVAVLAAGLPFLLPWTFRAKGPFRVEGTPRAWVHAGAEGILDHLTVVGGDTVRAGTPVATLWNPELEGQVLDLEKSVRMLEVRQANAEALVDLHEAASAAEVLERSRNELALLRTRKARLVLRAPINGIVLAQRLDERLGEALQEGDSLFEVASVRGRMARVRVPLSLAREIGPGELAHLKISAWPSVKIVSRVAAVAPAARNGWIEAEVPLPAGVHTPSPGMEGTAKIVTGHGTLAQAIGRAVRRTGRLDLWM